MAEFDIGAALIGDDLELVGILTDRDIILRVVVEGRNPVKVKVKEVMSASLFRCKEDDTIESIVAEMRERQIRRMPVVNEEGKTVGVVTLSDLAKGFTGPEQIQETIREISEPHRSREAPPEADAAAGEGRNEESAPDKPETDTPAKAVKRG